MRPSYTLPVLLSATFLSGCFGVAGGGNGLYYGGGGVTLFVLIVVAALVFGKRR